MIWLLHLFSHPLLPSTTFLSQSSCRVRRDIQFEANMKQIFIWLKVNKTGFIPLLRNEANRRILHAKLIKTEANIPF
jgi:hypothetical protein